MDKIKDKEIYNIVIEFVKAAKSKYHIEAVILFGSYAKGNNREDSDIDIAVIVDDDVDIYDCMADLMGLIWNIDVRIEPHPINKKDYFEKSNFFIEEIISTGIKVA